MTLYDFELSGNCYKVRLLLALLDLPYNRVTVDLAAKEQFSDWYRRISARSLVPVLTDGDVTIWDSTAILGFVAKRHAAARWYPQESVEHARVLQWLALAQNEILTGLAAARANFLFKRKADLALCGSQAMVALSLMEEALAKSPWLVGQLPTIADIACYPYVALAHEGEISIASYPSVRSWLARIEELPGYVGMPGIRLQPATPARRAEIG